MYEDCLEGDLKCLEGVWICLEGVCNILEGVLKVSKGFPNIYPFNVVRCPHPNCSPSTKYVRCPPSHFIFSPHPNCSLHQESMFGVPHSQYMFFSVRCPPPHPLCSSLSLPHLDFKQSWESGKLQLARWSHILFFLVHFACACVC